MRTAATTLDIPWGRVVRGAEDSGAAAGTRTAAICGFPNPEPQSTKQPIVSRAMWPWSFFRRVRTDANVPMSTCDRTRRGEDRCFSDIIAAPPRP